MSSLNFHKRVLAAQKKTTAVMLYLTEVFELDLAHIKELVGNIMLCVTIDEICENSTVTVFTFWSKDKDGHYTLMTDLNVLESCKAVSVSPII